MNDKTIHEAVEAVQAKDRRMRRGFVALGLLVIVALAINGVIQYQATAAVRAQTEVLQIEGQDRDTLINLLRRRFRALEQRMTNQHRKMNRLLLRIIERAQRGEEPIITREEVAGLFNGPQQGELENGGGAGGDGDTGGESPPPPPPISVSPQPSPVGGNPPGVCPPKNPHC